MGKEVGMGKQVKVIAEIDEEQRRALYHHLLDENLSFAEWLRRSIDAYLAEKKPKGNRRKGKAG
jgi:hypothetical protein